MPTPGKDDKINEMKTTNQYEDITIPQYPYPLGSFSNTILRN